MAGSGCAPVTAEEPVVAATAAVVAARAAAARRRRRLSAVFAASSESSFCVVVAVGGDPQPRNHRLMICSYPAPAAAVAAAVAVVASPPCLICARGSWPRRDAAVKCRLRFRRQRSASELNPLLLSAAADFPTACNHAAHAAHTAHAAQRGHHVPRNPSAQKHNSSSASSWPTTCRGGAMSMSQSESIRIIAVRRKWLLYWLD